MEFNIDSGTGGYFPPQKVSDKDKTKDWYKGNVKSSMSLAYIDQGTNKHTMQVLTDLDNDIIDQQEIERVFNPLDIEYASFPASLKNYPLSVPKIDLLQGEELKRRFEYVVRSKNDNAYSSHQTDLQAMLMEILIDELTNTAFNEEQAELRLKKFSKYGKYEWKDVHELTATRILEYLHREQDIQDKFNRGFRDALVKGQEIYRIDEVGGEPRVIQVDPRKVYSIRRGTSEKIEDSDIILEIDYLPVGAIIDEFHDYLTSAEVTTLETGRTNNAATDGTVLGYEAKHPPIYSNLDPGTHGEGFLPLNDFVNEYNLFSMPYDTYGNVRVVRCRWRGRRKVGRLTYFDENGDEQTKLVPDNYKIDKELGETVKWIWINEAYEATLLGDDIYVKMQPREVQMRHFDNVSHCFLGYVGTDYGKSLMSRMEPYQYIYNVYMRRLELVLAKYKGPIYELDISKVPDEWDLDKWMYYADVMGYAVVDPFNEGKKGSATGKLAGNFNTTGKVLDPNIGSYIQQIIMMLQYIENQMGEIAGVTKQRQGQVDNRETVGGVERAVTQSSHITEKWFFVHDETKRRVLHALLDTAKYVWKKVDSKKLNYILDDMSRVFLEVNPSEITSTEFDLFVSNSFEDMELKQTIKGLAQAGIQNGLGMGAMITALRESSITAMARTIDEAEELSFQRQEQANKANIEAAQAEKEAEMAEADKDRQLKKYEVDQKTAVEYAKIGAQGSEDKGSEDIGKQEDIDLKRDKQNLDEKKHQDDISIKERQLQESIRSNKASESISRSKPKSTSK